MTGFLPCLKNVECSFPAKGKLYDKFEIKQANMKQNKTLFSLSEECWSFRSSELQIWHIAAMTSVYCSHQAVFKKQAGQEMEGCKKQP